MTMRWSKKETEALRELLQKFPVYEITAKAQRLSKAVRNEAGRPKYKDDYAATIWTAIETTRRLPPGNLSNPQSVETAAKLVHETIENSWRRRIGFRQTMNLYREHQARLEADPETYDFSIKNIEAWLRARRRAGSVLLPLGLAVIGPYDPKLWGSTQKK
jgi:hypothetical protein